MDHHCILLQILHYIYINPSLGPWLNNCVGHQNHPYFLRFLFFVNVTCIWSLVMSCTQVQRYFDNNYYYSVITIFKYYSTNLLIIRYRE
jgi:hypothetical protein